MIFSRRVLLAAPLAVLAVTLTACSSTVSGDGSNTPTHVASTAPSSTTSPAPVPSTSAVAPTTAAPTSTAAPPPATSSAPPHGSGGIGTVTQAPTLRCTGSAQKLVDCFGNSLAAYWVNHEPADSEPVQNVLVEIPLPPDDECVTTARMAEVAFTCKDDGQLYFVPKFQKFIAKNFSVADRPYAYASVLSHEYGHFLQLTVHDPAVQMRQPSQRVSQAVEQQADCLSGVWAHDAAINHHFDAGTFNAVAQRLIKLVSTNPEIYTHGTPAQRSAMLDKGLGTGKESSCGLSGLR